MKWISFVVHAEKLHDDAVWQRVDRIVRRMAKQGRQATFFVYPFRAQVAGQNINERVRALSAMGHEIGQHTHFYKGSKIDKPDKVNDFSQDNIAYCLRRDFETLRQMGMTPKGFTAGAWFLNETVWDTLIELGLDYDCSVRFPKPHSPSNFPYFRWQKSASVYTNAKGSLLIIPTTCSLAERFRWGRKVIMDDSEPYQLIYLHDYDLLSAKKYALLWFFLTFGERVRFIEVRALAEQIGSSKRRSV
jgi:peptidoglycan/xylan/chitin deacetylase (PgdA/CDA1 family)